MPDRLLEDLKNAADTAYELDLKMEQLQQEMEEIKHAHQAEASGEFQLLIDNQKISIPQNLLKLLSGGE
ncbi:hypothetical protein HMSSN139_00630 [Paenibacillus sp. HMSSN-139]|nr:hypothetical protein HMSSN139_00630 [Paenibacillus sp. HMSSN-139]